MPAPPYTSLLAELEANPTAWPPPDFLDKFDFLTEREMQVLWLRFELGLSQGETGKMLTPATIAQGVGRIEREALMKLKSHLRQPKNPALESRAASARVGAGASSSRSTTDRGRSSRARGMANRGGGPPTAASSAKSR